MITLGVDLAAQAKKTAVCRLRWSPDGVSVMDLARGFENRSIVELSTEVDAVGVDAPFGFPELITVALPEYADRGVWPRRPDDLSAVEWQLRLRFRETDRVVHDVLSKERGATLWPLSASSNLIAVCAWRCADLIADIAAVVDGDVVRSGQIGERLQIAEVYPAAALAWWRLPYRGYKPGAANSAKSVAAAAKRAQIADGLISGLACDVDISPAQRDALHASDDLLDAFVSALVTRAALMDSTHQPTDGQRDRARREGWIHIPRCELRELQRG